MDASGNSPPSRWTRFIPRQFSLRALLVVITISAGFVWWYIQPPKGTISAWQAQKFRVGMTKEEVMTIAGDAECWDTNTGPNSVLIFEVNYAWPRSRSDVFIMFAVDRVKEIVYLPVDDDTVRYR
jgi:hypothetical protein